MSEHTSFDEFVAAAQSAFTVCGSPDGALELQLTKVSERRVVADTESFSLEFSGPNTLMLRQGMVELNHADLGQLEMFIVPIGSDVTSNHYEAVFNRFVTQSAEENP